MRITAGRLLTAADLAATCLFAIKGAIVARYANLDVFGVLVIGLAVCFGLRMLGLWLGWNLPRA